MKPPTGKAVKRIGGKRKKIGLSEIQVPLKDLGLIIDVELIVIS